MDPFAKQRDATNDPFAEQQQTDLQNIAGSDDMALGTSPTGDRKMSREWGKSCN
jgi:hypothetical protein